MSAKKEGSRGKSSTKSRRRKLPKIVPRVVLSAAMAGTPVLATACGGGNGGTDAAVDSGNFTVFAPPDAGGDATFAVAAPLDAGHDGGFSVADGGFSVADAGFSVAAPLDAAVPDATFSVVAPADAGFTVFVAPDAGFAVAAPPDAGFTVAAS